MRSQNTNVTHGQTDRHTDVMLCYIVAYRANNVQ